MDVAELSHEYRGGSQLKATQTHQSLNRWIHPSLWHLHRDQVLESSDALSRLIDRR